MKTTIKVSPEVIAALSNSDKTADELLREVLHVRELAGMTTSDGVTFPEGSLFLAWHKDRPHWGRIQNGELVIEGARFRTLASATRHVTHRGGSGWDFWMVKLPDSPDFVKADTLRNLH